MTTDSPTTAHHVAIIGGGPAGLMAAEVLAQGGVRVELFDAMPSVGRKFLLAGVGGMNITHSEPKDTFISIGAACLILDEILRWRKSRAAQAH